MEEELRETKKELEKLKITVKEQADKLATKTKLTFSENESTTDYHSSDYSTDAESKTKRRKRKQRKTKPEQKLEEASLKKVLKNHQRIIKQLAEVVLENNQGNESLNTNVNNLSSKQLGKAIRQTNRLTPCGLQDQPTPPKISEDEICDIKSLREYTQMLKDLFKNPLGGQEHEDLQGLLRNVSKITETGKLTLDQFYSLLLSRIQMGSDLYHNISDHNKWKSSPKTLYEEILPIFGKSNNYITHLNSLTFYKPGPTDTAGKTLSAVRTLATAMADSADCDNRQEYILQLVRNKLMTLYPTVAPALLEREKLYKPKIFGEWSRIFLDMAPLIEANKRSNRNAVNETNTEDEPVFEIAAPSKAKPIKLTAAVAEQLRGKCYKCGGLSSQSQHYGKDCDWYKHTPHAYYLCSKCGKGVHLPKFCQQGEEINEVDIEIMTLEEESSTPKNY